MSFFGSIGDIVGTAWDTATNTGRGVFETVAGINTLNPKLAEQGINQTLSSLFPSSSGPQPQAPPPAPTEAESVNSALDAQLQNELNIRRSMAGVTGGMGVGASPVTSAGQMLMGAR
jgi:hypothetical protein